MQKTDLAYNDKHYELLADVCAMIHERFGVELDVDERCKVGDEMYRQIVAAKVRTNVW